MVSTLAHRRTVEAPQRPRAVRVRERGDGWGVRAWSRCRTHLPVVLVLVTQAALSVRLIPSNTAYVDEADYLWAGSQIWQSGLHTLGFEEYFSGSPMIYPVIASAVDALGGLTAARLLSTACMLGVTACVYATTRRLFNATSGFFAAALVASLASIQFMGAFATYDAMALLLLTASLWCVVRSTGEVPSEKHFVAAAVLLLLANMTKYATMLYNPVVVIVAVLLFARRAGPRLAIRRGIVLSAIVIILGGLFLLAAGSGYWRGLAYTTVFRAPGTDPPAEILTSTLRWIGVLAVVALAGLLACWFRYRRTDRLVPAALTVLVVAAALAPLNQARIHEMQSLDKHVGFGAVFAAVAAGYGLAQLSGTRARAWYRYALPAAVILFAGVLGVQQSWVMYHRWPDSSEFMRVLDGLTEPGREQYLVQDYDLAAYYMDPGIARDQWSGVITFSYEDPRTHRTLHGLPAWRTAIEDRHFEVVAPSGRTRVDRVVQRTVRNTPGYVLVARIRNNGTGYGIGYYRIWERR